MNPTFPTNLPTPSIFLCLLRSYIRLHPPSATSGASLPLPARGVARSRDWPAPAGLAKKSRQNVGIGTTRRWCWPGNGSFTGQRRRLPPRGPILSDHTRGRHSSRRCTIRRRRTSRSNPSDRRSAASICIFWFCPAAVRSVVAVTCWDRCLVLG